MKKCKHGTILYGSNCLNCEREKTECGLKREEDRHKCWCCSAALWEARTEDEWDKVKEG